MRWIVGTACLVAGATLFGAPGAGLAQVGPAAVNDPAGLVLADGFEEGRFSEGGHLFYKDNAEQRHGKVVFQTDTVHSGKAALSLTLTPSCPPVVPGTETPDCSERAEIWEKPQVLAGYDRTVWYRFAVRLADPVPTDDGRYVLAQWKREIGRGVDHDYSPFLALRLYRGKLGITVETDEVPTFPLGTPERPAACKPGEAVVSTRPALRQTRALVAIEEGTSTAAYPGNFEACAPAISVTRHADLPSASAGWVDLVFRSRPGARGDGHLEVLANGRHIVTVKGHVGHDGPGLGQNQYFKFGPYRAPSPSVWTVHYDSFARGPRCADVMEARHCPPD